METFLIIIVILMLSAFFSGLEIAFVSSNKLRFELDKTEMSITGKILSHFFEHSNTFISTLLVGNNIALVVYGIEMARVIEPWLQHMGVDDEGVILLLQTIISTIIVLVTGEFLPKTLFKINPNKTLMALAVPAYIFYIALYPLSQFTALISRIVLRIAGMSTEEESEKSFSKVDLDYLIQSSLDKTDDKKEIQEEVRIFQNALEFPNLKVRDCMVPRTEIEAVSLNTDVEELKSHFIESGYSKIIVYKDNIDNIVGFIHSSEMFRHADDWMKYIRPIPVVPETMAAKKLLKTFLQQKKSIAVIVDEFGGTSGIVAMEDIVEEIFGDIEDEHDNTTYTAKELGEGEYLLSGRLEIEKVNELFQLDLPESDDYQTVGGLILNKYQSFPKLNEVIEIGCYQFKIVKSTTTKIELVRLKVKSQ